MDRKRARVSGLKEAKNCTPANAEIFFNAHYNRQAIELCLECPLMVKCGQRAREDGEIHGVWGGETAEERCVWLAKNHPDLNVRYEATKELDEIQHRRDVGRRASQRKKAGAAPKPLSRTMQMRLLQRERREVREAERAEQAVKARVMRSVGVTVADIADELGISTRSVERYLSAHYDNVSA